MNHCAEKSILNYTKSCNWEPLTIVYFTFTQNSMPKKSNHVQKCWIDLTVGNFFEFPFADFYCLLISINVWFIVNAMLWIKVNQEKENADTSQNTAKTLSTFFSLIWLDIFIFRFSCVSFSSKSIRWVCMNFNFLTINLIISIVSNNCFLFFYCYRELALIRLFWFHFESPTITIKINFTKGLLFFRLHWLRLGLIFIAFAAVYTNICQFILIAF